MLLYLAWIATWQAMYDPCLWTAGRPTFKPDLSRCRQQHDRGALR